MIDFTYEPLPASEIFCQFYGSFEDDSRPCLILIHGLQSSSETFESVAPKFEQLGFNVLAYDQRGHGKTPRKGEKYTVEVMADDLKNLMDYYKIEKAHIVGHSMGGRTLMGMLKKYPERVLSAIIEDMGIHQRRSDQDDESTDRLNRARATFKETRFFDTKEEVLKILTDAYNANDAKWFMANKLFPTDDGKWELKFYPDAALLYGLQGNFTDLTEVMKKTTVPVLYLKADPELDAVLTDNCASHILEHIPDANIVELKQADHSIHKSAQASFVEKVVKFIES